MLGVYSAGSHMSTDVTNLGIMLRTVKVKPSIFIIANIMIYTYNPNDPCFDGKGPCFGGLTFKNRG